MKPRQKPVVDLVARVQKLLALSTSSNVHEAALARRRAQELIDRHHLDAAGFATTGDAIDDAIDDGRGDPLEVAQRPRRWRRVLADALARENGGVVWSFVDDAGDTALCFCGRKEDRAVVKELFVSLARTLEWLSASAGPGKPRQWHEAFRVGAVDVVLAGAAPEDAALVVVAADKFARVTAAEAYAAAHGLDAGVDNFLVDARAYAKGKAAALPARSPRRR